MVFCALMSLKRLVRAAQWRVAPPKTHWCTPMQVYVRMRGCCFTPRGCSWSGLVTSWIVGTLDAHAQHSLIEVTWSVSRVRRIPLDTCWRLGHNCILVEVEILALLACERIKKVSLIVKEYNLWTSKLALPISLHSEKLKAVLACTAHNACGCCEAETNLICRC